MSDAGSGMLRADEPAAVGGLLRERGWIEADEAVVSCGRAGEGNMNLVLRVVTDRRRVIVKQSRPWVEKYPQVAAPVERIAFEHRFYEAVAEVPAVARRMPRVLGYSEADRVLLLEDLGDASDFTGMYRGERIDDETLGELAAWLRTLHSAACPPSSLGEGLGEGGSGEREASFANRAMRALNHEHIFRFPLNADNGLPLDAHEPGLTRAAAKLMGDEAYRRRVEEAGRRYLADGGTLLHGDYFPGSWLRSAGGVAIIDPEFCFLGDREWDVAVTVAHLALAGQAAAIATFVEGYGDDGLDGKLLARFAAAEVMRRLIGVAQLPIPATDGFRADLLERSRHAMLTESLEPICRMLLS